MNKKRFLAQVCVYVIGLFILALGVPFAINSDLGISPVNALPFAVHLSSGIGIGLSVSLFFVACILFQIVLLRKDFKWINVTQIIFSFLFGFFLDITVFLVGDFSIPTYLGQLVMLSISMVLIAIGLSVYLEAKLISLPSEGVVLAVVEKVPKYTFHQIKIIMDCILVAMAIATTLIFMGGIYGVREGTIISAIMIGKLIPYVRKVIIPTLDKVGFYKVMNQDANKIHK